MIIDFFYYKTIVIMVIEVVMYTLLPVATAFSSLTTTQGSLCFNGRVNKQVSNKMSYRDLRSKFFVILTKWFCIFKTIAI